MKISISISTIFATLFIMQPTLLLAQPKDLEVLEGLWEKPCTTNGKITQVYFEDHNAWLSEVFYEYDGGCGTKWLSFVTHSSFEADKGIVDFKYQSIQVTLHHYALVSDFNGRKVCGFSDWQIDQARTINGLSCALFQANRPILIPEKGSYRYGIYHIDNDKLFFGQVTKDKDGSSREKRPETFDPSPFYRAAQ